MWNSLYYYFNLIFEMSIVHHDTRGYFYFICMCTNSEITTITMYSFV